MNMTHAELIGRGVKWLRNNYKSQYRFSLILTEFFSFSDERPDIIGFSNNSSIVIECKVSLTDFKADLKKPHRQSENKLGQMRCYLCPADLIPKDVVPEGWGLLYAHNHMITIEIEPPWHVEDSIKKEEYKVLYSVARRVLAKGLMPKILEPIPQMKVIKKPEGVFFDYGQCEGK
jgi:hypothetical protein